MLSNEVDLVNDPPPQDVPRLKQDPNIKVLEGTENRIVFIGMDQNRDELLYSSVKGKNPFKDKRVRQALYQAIDIEAIKSTTMRGLSQPSGAMLSSPVQSTPELEQRLPFDKAKAKQLMTDAGYGSGFDVTMDCPNNRYVNDEKICQALAAMWAQIGINVRVNAMPRANYFPKLEKTDTSMYMLGLGRWFDRQHLHPAAGAVDVQRQGRRRLQLWPLFQSQARRADGQGQGRHESGAAAEGNPRRPAPRTTPRSITFRCTGRSFPGPRAATSRRFTAPTIRSFRTASRCSRRGDRHWLRSASRRNASGAPARTR